MKVTNISHYFNLYFCFIVRPIILTSQLFIIVFFIRASPDYYKAQCTCVMTMLRLVLLLPLTSLSSAQQLCSRSVCLPPDYNKMDRPETTGGGPLLIHFSMRLLDIYHISHRDFTISIGVQYSLSWTDNRLVLLGNKSEINMDVDFIKTLWVGFGEDSQAVTYYLLLFTTTRFQIYIFMI